MKKALVFASAAVAVALAGSPAQAQDQTIAEIASGDDRFSTLVAALGAANLVSPFDSCSDAPTTVFAPTNDAFEAAFDALGVTAEQVLADTELLTDILTYHVVSGAVDAATVVTLDSAQTLNGASIDIAVSGSNVTLNGNVNVTATDIEACNGIIHVIDGVLLPPSDPAAPAPLPDTGAEPGVIAAFAAGLVGIGALGTLAARRRRADVRA